LGTWDAILELEFVEFGVLEVADELLIDRGLVEDLLVLKE